MGWGVSMADHHRKYLYIKVDISGKKVIRKIDSESFLSSS